MNSIFRKITAITQRKATESRHLASIQPIRLAPSQLVRQLTTGENLEQAYQWLSDKTNDSHRVKKGFDFLGFHCHPTGMTVSEATLSRRDQKVTRLSKASKHRVGVYLQRWAGWVCLMGLAGCAPDWRAAGVDYRSNAELCYAAGAHPPAPWWLGEKRYEEYCMLPAPPGGGAREVRPTIRCEGAAGEWVVQWGNDCEGMEQP